MTPSGFSENSILTRQPSKIMLGFLVGTHLLALASLYLSDLEPGLSGFLSLAIVCHGYHVYRQSCLLLGRDVVKRLLRRNDLWFLLLADGRQVAAELVGDMVVLEWFVSLQFRHDKKVYPLVLWNDSANQDELRHLRVWLRLHAGQQLAW